MREVIFHPFWGVPDGIKKNELQPGLARGYNTLAKNGLRIQSGGRDIDPTTVDWQTADLRRFHVYQPPGAANVLGVVKFRFPNKHDVYMHDTPSKSLFNEQVRAFSHGCMRVRDPLKLAEVVLAEDRGMTPDKVRALAAPGSLPNNQINLTRKIPVHITYFTAWVDDDGKVRTFNDIYGHETRIALGLEGKAHLIVQPKEPGPAAPIGRLAESQWGWGNSKGGNKDWVKQIFGF